VDEFVLVRHTEEFELRLLEIDHLFLFVVDDARALDLPERRLFRIILTGFACGIDAALQHGIAALAAVDARCRKAGGVRRFQSQRINEAVAVIVVELENVAVRDVAAGFGQTNVAFGAQPLGLLVIGDLVGLDGRAVIVDLHVADGIHAFIDVVVLDLRRLNHHLLVATRGRRLSRLWLGWPPFEPEEIRLSRSRRHRRQPGQGSGTPHQGRNA
jgi:hypothetical protein